jgi:hypothetical protein
MHQSVRNNSEEGGHESVIVEWRQEKTCWIPCFANAAHGVQKDVVDQLEKKVVDVGISSAAVGMNKKLESVKKLEGQGYGCVWAERAKMNDDF